jgi:hypothetical protein
MMPPNNEIREGIRESRKTLKGFRWFGIMVQEALKALDEIELYVDDPQPEEKPRIARIVKEMNERIGPYKGFVPVLVKTLTKLDAWLKDQP